MFASSKVECGVDDRPSLANTAACKQKRSEHRESPRIFLILIKHGKDRLIRFNEAPLFREVEGKFGPSLCIIRIGLYELVQYRFALL